MEFLVALANQKIDPSTGLTLRPPLPITPALEAVANPSITDDLFFVADGTGGHVFAKTLEEHNANVLRWRAIERRRKEEAAAAAQNNAENNSDADGNSQNNSAGN